MRRTETTLRAMARMRHLVVEEARRGLADCLAAERAAARRERDAAGALAQEQALAASPEAGDAVVEAYAAWLPTGLGALEDARAARDRAEAAIAQARARLNAARLADGAVQRRLADLAVAERAEALKQEQAALDEVARGRPRRA
jgi:hypothetical protein